MTNNTATALIYELQTSSKCILWSGEYWNRWLAQHVLQSNQPSLQQQQQQHDNDLLIIRIPHERLSSLIASLVELLKNFLQLDESDKTKVICVGIAEGPYLPLAILALHALTLSSEGRVVLCPVEVEVMDSAHTPHNNVSFNHRTASILEDVRCDLLLVRGSAGAAADISRQNEFECLDVDDLVGEALEEMIDIEKNYHLLLPKQMTCGDDSGDEESSYRYISHIVYTSGTTGKPKGCVASMKALRHYIWAKNKAHGICAESTVLLASAVSFDPCLSDIIATYCVGGCLALPCRSIMQSDMSGVLHRLRVTHVLCTPSLWRIMPPLSLLLKNSLCACLEVVALGGEKTSERIIQQWARTDSSSSGVRLLLTYGVTEGW